MVVIGQLAGGDAVELDGSLWTVERIERGDGVYHSASYLSVKLVSAGGSEFGTGGWHTSPLSELALTCADVRHWPAAKTEAP